MLPVACRLRTPVEQANTCKIEARTPCPSIVDAASICGVRSCCGVEASEVTLFGCRLHFAMMGTSKSQYAAARFPTSLPGALASPCPRTRKLPRRALALWETNAVLRSRCESIVILFLILASKEKHNKDTYMHACIHVYIDIQIEIWIDG